MGAATGNRDGLNRNLYEEISLLYVACGEKMRGRACRVGGAKPAAGVCVPKCTACCVEIAVGRRKAPQRSSKCAIALWAARAKDGADATCWQARRGRMAERTPLWGSDDVSAMRNYRYRHRDSPYVAERSGGNEHPGPGDRGRSAANFPERGGAKACVRAMRSAVRGAAAAPTRGCRFFSSTSTLDCGAGRRRGGKADRSVQRPVRLVRCVGHGVGARGVGAVGLHVRGGARGTGRAGQRRGMRRGVKPHCAAWAMIRAAGQPFAPPWASALSERPFRPRRKPRAPVRTWPQRPG